MNNKHLACLLLFGVIIGCFQLSMVMRNRMTNAREEQLNAEEAYEQARNTRNLQQISLQTLQQSTAARRAYLERWMPKLEDTDEETKARALVSRVLKQNGEGLVTFSSRSSVDVNKDSAFIPKKFRSTLSVEGDYGQVIALIGGIERELPASRLSLVGINKGQRGSDVKLNLTVDIPMIAKAEAKKE